jgi:hypothetical protein
MAFYLGILYTIVRSVLEVVPVTNLALKANSISQETASLEERINKYKEKLKEHEKLRAYLDKKDKWAVNSISSGLLTAYAFYSIPQNVKLRGCTYAYNIEPNQLYGTVKLRLQFRGATETGRISSTIRQIDPRLVMINNRQLSSDQGTELEVEYKIQP